MIQVCPQCGAVNTDGGQACAFCDMPFELQDEVHAVAPVGARYAVAAAAVAPAREEVAVAMSSDQPEWRIEVARRLHAYRARRRQSVGPELQSPLPFAEESEGIRREDRFDRPAYRLGARPRRNERVEIRVSQSELDFSAGDCYRVHPNTAIVPVADLHVRRHAGTLDAIFIALADAGFLFLFRSLGGSFSFTEYDVIVYGATLFLFYAAYFVLFTTFNGATPGMQFRRLSVVNMDGGLPGIRQLLWRSFGYILSGVTLLLGFLWAVWDEDHLTWQDRISQTYVTAATPLHDLGTFEAAHGHHRFAHK